MSDGTRVPVTSPDDFFEADEQMVIPEERKSGIQLRGSFSLTSFAEQAIERESRRKPRKFGSSKTAIERAKADMDRMAEAGDWSEARGTHLVALYGWLFEVVYGVSPTELNNQSWAIAASMATRLVDQQFKNDYGAAVQFMRWVWKREDSREKWRRENKRDGRAIGYRLQFGGALVTEYRIGIARTGNQA